MIGGKLENPSQTEYRRVPTAMVCYLLHSQLHTSAIRPVEEVKLKNTVFCEKGDRRSKPLGTGQKAIAIEAKNSYRSAVSLYLLCMKSVSIQPV
jgi:hypothetical protein